MLCKTCRNNYYLSLDKKTCIFSEIDNCMEYDNTEKECLYCEKGYALVDPHHCQSIEGSLECERARAYRDVEFGAVIGCE